MTQMYRAGARRYFDSLAINSYAEESGRAARGCSDRSGELMNRHGDRRGQLWITEIGWGDHGPKHRLIVGAAGQARADHAGVRRDQEAAASAAAERSRLLQLAGRAPYPPQYRDMWGLHTGLLDINGGFKPAFYAFKNGVARLR